MRPGARAGGACPISSSSRPVLGARWQASDPCRHAVVAADALVPAAGGAPTGLRRTVPAYPQQQQHAPPAATCFTVAPVEADVLHQEQDTLHQHHHQVQRPQQPQQQHRAHDRRRPQPQHAQQQRGIVHHHHHQQLLQQQQQQQHLHHEQQSLEQAGIAAVTHQLLAEPAQRRHAQPQPHLHHHHQQQVLSHAAVKSVNITWQADALPARHKLRVFRVANNTQPAQLATALLAWLQQQQQQQQPPPQQLDGVHHAHEMVVSCMSSASLHVALQAAGIAAAKAQQLQRPQELLLQPQVAPVPRARKHAAQQQQQQQQQQQKQQKQQKQQQQAASQVRYQLKLCWLPAQPDRSSSNAAAGSLGGSGPHNRLQQQRQQQQQQHVQPRDMQREHRGAPPPQQHGLLMCDAATGWHAAAASAVRASRRHGSPQQPSGAGGRDGGSTSSSGSSSKGASSKGASSRRARAQLGAAGGGVSAYTLSWRLVGRLKGGWPAGLCADTPAGALVAFKCLVSAQRQLAASGADVFACVQQSPAAAGGRAGTAGSAGVTLWAVACATRAGAVQPAAQQEPASEAFLRQQHGWHKQRHRQQQREQHRQQQGARDWLAGVPQLVHATAAGSMQTAPQPQQDAVPGLPAVQHDAAAADEHLVLSVAAGEQRDHHVAPAQPPSSVGSVGRSGSSSNGSAASRNSGQGHDTGTLVGTRLLPAAPRPPFVLRAVPATHAAA